MKIKPWQIIVGVLLAIPVISMLRSEPAPDIPQAAIDQAVAFIEDDPSVRDATIVIDGKRIGLVAVVTRATSKSHAHQVGDSFVRRLGSLSAQLSTDNRLRKSPTRDYFGGLWDHYDADVIIALDADTEIARAFIISGTHRLSW